MQVSEILDAAKTRLQLTSDNALAVRLDVSRQRVSNWRNGTHYPDEAACEKLAKFSGIALNVVVGTVGEQRAISSDAKRVWRKIAGLAAGVFLASLMGPGHATIPTNGHQMTDSEGCIMRSLRKLLRQAARALSFTAVTLNGLLHGGRTDGIGAPAVLA